MATAYLNIVAPCGGLSEELLKEIAETFGVTVNDLEVFEGIPVSTLRYAPPRRIDNPCACSSNCMKIAIFVDQPGVGRDDDDWQVLGSVGHAWWGIYVSSDVHVTADSRQYVNVPVGYYPDGLPTPTADGLFRYNDDDHPIDIYRIYDIPSGQDLANVLKYTRRLDEDPGTYNLCTNNCANKAVKAAFAAGVNIPIVRSEWFKCPSGISAGSLGMDLYRDH